MKAVACNQRHAWLIRVTKSFTSMTRGGQLFRHGAGMPHTAPIALLSHAFSRLVSGKSSRSKDSTRMEVAISISY